MDDGNNVAYTLPPRAGQPFLPRTHRQALTELVRGILAGEPFVALTGKPGVGKTTVLNTAITVLDERNLRIRRIGNPLGTPLRLPQMIGELLGNPAGSVTTQDVERLFDTLTSSNNGEQLVLVFDDAQHLQADVLGYLQIISSLHALGIRHQRVIFTAQPEFWDLLKDPKLCDLVERINVRPVIEPLDEAEAWDFLCYRLEQTYGPIRQQVCDAALSRLVHHGAGFPGRLDLLLTKSLVAAGGDRQLRPETVDAIARSVGNTGRSVAAPAESDESAAATVAPPRPPAAKPKAPERRYPVLYPGALVCLAVLLVGGIGTATWRSSVLSGPREINGSVATTSTLPADLPIRVAIVRTAGAPGPLAMSPDTPTESEPSAPIIPDTGRSNPEQATVAEAPAAAESSTHVPASNHEASSATVASAPAAAMTSSQDMSSPPPQVGVAAPADRPQDSPPESAASPPASHPPSPIATMDLAASQPPDRQADSAGDASAAVSPQSTDAIAPSEQSPAASSASLATPVAAVAAQATAPTEAAAQRSDEPPPSAETRPMIASPSNGAELQPTPAIPAASAQAVISPTSPGRTRPAAQRDAAPLPARTAPLVVEDTAPAASVPSVPINPAPAETVAPARRSPDLSAIPAGIGTARQTVSLPPGIVAELLRRGDAMLAIGDISSARLLYTRAAESGDARAETELGKTYDPSFLVKIGATGTPTDPETAAKWYRKAADLGDAEASKMLKRLREAEQ